MQTQAETTGTEIVTDVETKIISRSNLLVGSASRAVIDSQESMERGADLTKQLKSLAKIAEEERVRKVKPLKEEAKEIDERFKAIINPLTAAAKVVELKMFTFTKEQERIAREEQEERRRVEEQQRRDCDDSTVKTHLIVPSVETIAAIAVPEITRGVMGSTASIRKTWTYELVDIVALANSRPDLVTVDSAKINAEIRGKGGEIAGLRIFQQETMSVR